MATKKKRAETDAAPHPLFAPTTPWGGGAWQAECAWCGKKIIVAADLPNTTFTYYEMVSYPLSDEVGNAALTPHPSPWEHERTLEPPPEPG